MFTAAAHMEILRKRRALVNYDFLIDLRAAIAGQFTMLASALIPALLAARICCQTKASSLAASA
ncbi:MAG TPA: hypothetical protein VK639_10125, partial [Terriglobales bacterium]|nr:hypothetical protein [Terriglobales bacterium]